VAKAAPFFVLSQLTFDCTLRQTKPNQTWFGLSQFAANQTNSERIKNMWLIENALKMRKDKGYRCGLIQAFRMCNVITQAQWQDLKNQIHAGVAEPKIKPNQV
jgi:hypothetical protein